METLYQDSSASATISFTGEKVCRKCETKRHITEFPRCGSGRNAGGRSNVCKPCKRLEGVARYKTRPADANAKRRADRSAVKEVFRCDVLHFGVDEKFGDQWRDLAEVLGVDKTPSFKIVSKVRHVLEDWEESRKGRIIKRDPRTGEMMKIASVSEAVKMGFNKFKIYNAISKSVLYKGFKWEYAQ